MDIAFKRYNRQWYCGIKRVKLLSNSCFCLSCTLNGRNTKTTACVRIVTAGEAVYLRHAIHSTQRCTICNKAKEVMGWLSIRRRLNIRRPMCCVHKARKTRPPSLLVNGRVVVQGDVGARRKPPLRVAHKVKPVSQLRVFLYLLHKELKLD